jgi:hypothetical protein
VTAPNAIPPLETYAAVIAGLGAGLALSRALELAGIAALQWEETSLHWQERIDESAASDLEVLVAFDAALLAAGRRFEPTVQPIETDARAWCHFRRHFLTAVDPPAFLAERGMSLSLWARLEADWSDRALGDEALAATIQAHMQEPLAECPEVILVPSPWLAPPALRLQPSVPPPSVPSRRILSTMHDGLTIVAHAQIVAELMAFPDARSDVLRRFDLDPRTDRVALERWWRDHIEGVPERETEWHMIYNEHYRLCVRGA